MGKNAPFLAGDRSMKHFPSIGNLNNKNDQQGFSNVLENGDLY
jgi:hypothetical protein